VDSVAADIQNSVATNSHHAASVEARQKCQVIKRKCVHGDSFHAARMSVEAVPFALMLSTADLFAVCVAGLLLRNTHPAGNVNVRLAAPGSIKMVTHLPATRLIAVNETAPVKVSS
jgi:hypothetical protein